VPDPEITRSAAIRYMAAVGQTEREAFTELFHPAVHFEDPVGAGVLLGHEGVARFHKGLARAWASLRMEPTALHVRGSQVAIAWRAVGRSSSGQAIDFDGIDVLEVDDAGLITRVLGYWDLESVIARM
jgi:steroid Delta-isomerase